MSQKIKHDDNCMALMPNARAFECDCGFRDQKLAEFSVMESQREKAVSKMITDHPRESALPTDSEVRKNLPMATGVLDYFPAALAAVAELSKVGNDKHNPGEDLHWARGKSMDHADTILRHLAERGTVDTDRILHDVKVAWRALAMLQEELEKRGAPMSRGSKIAVAEDGRR